MPTNYNVIHGSLPNYYYTDNAETGCLFTKVKYAGSKVTEYVEHKPSTKTLYDFTKTSLIEKYFTVDLDTEYIGNTITVSYTTKVTESLIKEKTHTKHVPEVVTNYATANEKITKAVTNTIVHHVTSTTGEMIYTNDIISITPSLQTESKTVSFIHTNHIKIYGSTVYLTSDDNLTTTKISVVNVTPQVTTIINTVTKDPYAQTNTYSETTVSVITATIRHIGGTVTETKTTAIHSGVTHTVTETSSVINTNTDIAATFTDTELVTVSTTTTLTMVHTITNTNYGETLTSVTMPMTLPPSTVYTTNVADNCTK